MEDLSKLTPAEKIERFREIKAREKAQAIAKAKARQEIDAIQAASGGKLTLEQARAVFLRRRTYIRKESCHG